MTSNKPNSSSSTQKTSSSPIAQDIHDLPPAYDTSNAESSNIKFPPPPELTSSNFVNISESKTCTGKFVLDPYLEVPESLLPPWEHDGSRANLRLHSKHSNTSAEVWVAAGTSHNANPETGKTNQPIIISAHSSSSSTSLIFSTAKLYIPSSFVGVIKAGSTHGKVHFSPALLAKSTALADIDGKRRLFVGDLSLYETEGWIGDEADVSAPHSNVYIYLEEDLQDVSAWVWWFGGGKRA
ncbi:hypothetical protein DL96DRAFT_1581273 [Flagelloscypha sp. PMI_526]|nr:hypothetical protein DL96DRAFT_1581273 [Flagelloscypha sp. PMI_526]